MSRRSLREGNEIEASMNTVDRHLSDAARIVKGGCYAPSWEDPTNFKSPPHLKPAPRWWVVVAAIALIVMIAFALSRYFSRR